SVTPTFTLSESATATSSFTATPTSTDSPTQTASPTATGSSTPTATPVCTQINLAGRNTVAGGLDPMVNGRLGAQRAVLATAGSLANVYAYFSTATGAQVRAAVYSDSAGYPGAK